MHRYIHPGKNFFTSLLFPDNPLKVFCFLYVTCSYMNILLKVLNDFPEILFHCRQCESGGLFLHSGFHHPGNDFTSPRMAYFFSPSGKTG